VRNGRREKSKQRFRRPGREELGLLGAQAKGDKMQKRSSGRKISTDNNGQSQRGARGEYWGHMLVASSCSKEKDTMGSRNKVRNEKAFYKVSYGERQGRGPEK